MFLGMHIGIHDTNISLYKDGKCYYAKYERHSGIKHGVGNLKWIKDTLKKWGVDKPETQIKHFVFQKKYDSVRSTSKVVYRHSLTSGEEWRPPF